MVGLRLEHVATLAEAAWRASPQATAARWSYGAWRRARHLRHLSDLVADGIARGGLRLLVSMPPRHGKSELVSHWLPVWLLSTWPERRVILCSYEATFAASWGRMVRNTLRDTPDLGVTLRDDSSAVEAWETTAGGGMVTAGVGGPITGRGADLLIIDDPVKNAEEAASPTVREGIWDWWQTTARTRLEPGASVIVVMTRWDQDDLAGRLQRDGTGQWQVVSLPAIAETGDAVGRAPGEALWPERYDLAALARLREDVGEDAWQSLYQQRPNPVGRGLYFDVEACNDLLRGCDAPRETRRGLVRIWKPRVVGGRYVAGGDCAWGEKGAYSVVSLHDFQTGEQVAELYGRPNADDLAEETVGLCREYNDAYLGIERNGEGRFVAQKVADLGYGDRMYWHDHDAKSPEQPGWLTQGQAGATRSVILAGLEEAVRTRAIRPHCQDGCKELLSFVRDEKSRPGPTPGTYADHVMAWAIGWEMRKWARWATAPGGRRPVRITYG